MFLRPGHWESSALMTSVNLITYFEAQLQIQLEVRAYNVGRKESTIESIAHRGNKYSSILLISFLILFMCMCVYVCGYAIGVWKSTEIWGGCWTSQWWSYGSLCIGQFGCWEPKISKCSMSLSHLSRPILSSFDKNKHL